MKTIGSKKEIEELAARLSGTFREKGMQPMVAQLHTSVLKRKVRFPVLEFLTEKLAAVIPGKDQLAFTDAVVALDEIGSYVIAGKMLQLRMEKDFSRSFEKACSYFAQGDEWYVCDIIGERVFGVALLRWPEKTIPVLRKYTQHPDRWVVRSVGIATHYAVKKGLPKPFVNDMFGLLLTRANATEFHTKRGIGWGAKTIAKFYPDIISSREAEIENAAPGTWFRTKIKIGLGRASKYAGRFSE